MSTPTVDMARSPFSTAAFAQLVRRLRSTNARYNQIAHQFRCRIRPTHHAKRRAYRAGLRIDIPKARACPTKYVSVQSLPVLERSAVSASWVDPPANAYVPVETGVGIGAAKEGHGAGQGDAYMRGLQLPPLRSLPGVGMRKPRRRDGRRRVTLRLPPLKLSLNVNYGCSAPYYGPAPGAPRLKPRQLPEEDSGMEEIMLASGPSSSSSSMDDPDLLLTPLDVRMYSGLCITIPPRGMKRKLQDPEADEDISPSQQPKRALKARWNASQRH